MCLVDMPLKDGVAAGLVLSNSKDTIVNCFGFRETFVRNDMFREFLVLMILQTKTGRRV